MLAFISHTYIYTHITLLLYKHIINKKKKKEINMGNCQAIDNASLIIQHPTGKVEKLYSAISAAEVMKLNPGHYVALLLTTTLYSSTTKRNDSGDVSANPQPLRVTRIKLLRHTESLMVGHVYRLVTTQGRL
ncbi:hypothetical protein HanOQP8_Chr04g0134981 [Helianthus annuus]|nr:hypothetical protein HanLR1_Chr04g0126811 [Helianthus annuus]KAJ0760167.1 hypothetical protein HanOQP8_Chr04g0134981 [Helianthus annuus]